jgi:pyruvate kinase
MWRAVEAEANKTHLEALAAAGVTHPVATPRPAGIMVSIKGLEVRTSRLQADLAKLPVGAGDTLLLVGVGDDYYQWRGGAAGPTDKGATWRVGLSLTRPGQVLKPGDVLQLDDGALKVQVAMVEGPDEVLGIALNAHQLPELSLVCVPPGASQGGGALSERDVADLTFAGRNGVDYVSVPFVQSAQHVQQVRPGEWTQAKQCCFVNTTAAGWALLNMPVQDIPCSSVHHSAATLI